jgi:hypothetical protein
VEAIRRIRINNSLASFAPVARNDADSRPTNPLPGSFLTSPLVQGNQHLSQMRGQNPSSRQQTSISADELWEHQ